MTTIDATPGDIHALARYASGAPLAELDCLSPAARPLRAKLTGVNGHDRLSQLDDAFAPYANAAEVKRRIAAVDPVQPVETTDAPASTSPEVRVEGDRSLYLWHDAKVAIGFERFVERHDGIQAEVSVASTTTPLDAPAGHIHWARLNLASTTARDTLTKYLVKATAATNLNWTKMVEYACTAAVRRFRDGRPIVDLSEMAEPPDQRYLIDKLVLDGRLSIIYSRGGSGKSLLAMALAIAVRTGTALPGGLVPRRQTGVLYLDYESDEEDQRTRLGHLARGLGLKAIPRIYCRRQTRPIAADIARLRAEVDRLDIGFVIVDSLAYALDGSPLDADVVIEGCNALRSLRKGVTPIAIAHVPKGERDDCVSSIFGSVFQENAARSVWELRSTDEPDGVSIGLWHRKVNWGKKQAPSASGSSSTVRSRWSRFARTTSPMILSSRRTERLPTRLSRRSATVA